MINPGRSYNIHDYWEIILRRRWYVLIPFVVVLIATIVYAIAAPRKYQAETLILVTPQRVPEGFVKPTVTSKIEERLQSIAQEIMSRTRLEQVIEEFRLDKGEYRSKSKEALVEIVRSSTKVQLKGKEGYFSIGFIWEDPRTPALVANKISSLFIEENLKLREQQSQGTTEFITNELTATKTRLEEQEKTITDFKRHYTGELPDQKEANFKVIEQLQMSYQRIGENLRAAEDRKLIIQKQLTDLELTGSTTTVDTSGPRAIIRDPYETQMEELQRHLEELQSRYTDKHPDIIAAKRKIAELESKKTVKKEGGFDVKKTPQYRELNNHLAAVNMDIKRLREDEQKVKVQIDRYRGKIENTPLREQAMASIMREYQNTKDQYDTLLKKSQEAQQAENLEVKQKGEQFRIIDPARVPQNPVEPNIPRVLLIGLMLALGSGFGIAFGREQLDRSFLDPDDLEATLGLRVLANIPKVGNSAA